ncbi:hypothetical protein GUITHDRAFT_155453 [Guillardia theta CCMP2712]|uniref:Transmembrane protein n=1 Tax=Guillardia theta (strain CCMP2712) TaxID=905079 RepID=L1IH54_GUITC|nr:hypothetical protein GUITHDRAFT_155453 [Guillardia theta CCMP2712]EKX35568.1 hypothetical protein GUITHDRAFT_155453 [Guillardia theta CCMP2712]|mmetsp:Transcript_35365/g.110545  ORF Transcript_35365/g.110545 Transcript_35365/m.110545 type:complete len:211 (-) Transcript_35365:128-760(-)|eukprot:XP_005822548.1 hypothetical protein GUITHDRAFT_155453 [Guillardia theta CCMP2712]
MKSRTRCADCFQAESLSRASRITLIDCSRHGREAAAKAGLVGLLVGSACCAAAAAKMRTDSSPLFTFFRICLALISICGFCRAFVRVVRPYNQLHYFRFLFAYVVAMTASSAVATLATLIAVVTAIRMCFKTALEYSVGKDPQKWLLSVASIAAECLEVGALILQMILMAQWVFGEFSVMPVLSSMSVMFTLLHHLNSFAPESLWWEDVF